MEPGPVRRYSEGMAITEIICTIGASREKPAIPQAMKNAGMDGARLNLSRGNHKEHQQQLDNIRKVDRETGHKVAVHRDLKSLRIRIGTFRNGSRTPLVLKQKQIVFFDDKDYVNRDETIPLDYPDSILGINTGDFIYIDDGNVALRLIDLSAKFIRCEVVFPGHIEEHKGVNIPTASFLAQGLTEKDRLDLQFGMENGVDFMAQAFVRSRQDMIDIREFLTKQGFRC